MGVDPAQPLQPCPRPAAETGGNRWKRAERRGCAVFQDLFLFCFSRPADLVRLPDQEWGANKSRVFLCEGVVKTAGGGSSLAFHARFAVATAAAAVQASSWWVKCATLSAGETTGDIRGLQRRPVGVVSATAGSSGYWEPFTKPLRRN